MSMHLSKIRVVEKSDKRKWPSAEAKRQAQDLEDSWNKLKAKYETPIKKSNATLAQKRLLDSGSRHLMAGFTPPRGRGPIIPSKGDSAGVAAKPESKVYTGDAMLGIATLHKSNAVPVFSTEEAVDISKMRR